MAKNIDEPSPLPEEPRTELLAAMFVSKPYKAPEPKKKDTREAAQDKELEKLRAEVERAKREAASQKAAAEQAAAKMDALKAMSKQYEARVMEVQQEKEENAADAAKYFVAHDRDAEHLLFWAQFENPKSNPSLSYQMKQLLELHWMDKPAMKDLCVRLWPAEPLSSSYFALMQKLIEVAPRIEALQCSSCVEGAQMAFAGMMVHFPGMGLLKMDTNPPPTGKEHRRPELYFTSAMEGARAIESQCSKDVLLE
ncbi:hypothetical protein ZWY2020_021182 [Hordeum vulgare]|nr:hypothetical protein ZWY2020_021182 [Hordeum vulgare]